MRRSARVAIAVLALLALLAFAMSAAAMSVSEQAAAPNNVPVKCAEGEPEGPAPYGDPDGTGPGQSLGDDDDPLDNINASDNEGLDLNHVIDLLRANPIWLLIGPWSYL